MRAVMVILILLFMREFARGFWEGFQQAGRDAAGIVAPTTHSGISLEATDLSLMLFVMITASMMSILRGTLKELALERLISLSTTCDIQKCHKPDNSMGPSYPTN
jgi:hypothetical protein